MPTTYTIKRDNCVRYGCYMLFWFVALVAAFIVGVAHAVTAPVDDSFRDRGAALACVMTFVGGGLIASVAALHFLPHATWVDKHSDGRQDPLG